MTGGAGFIGSHLTEALIARGHSVVALDDLTTGQLSNLEAVMSEPDLRFVQGTVLDQLLIDELVHDCDVVVHLAAATGVRQVIEHPMRSFTHNLRGSEIMIEAAHRYGRRILLASTSEVYGKNNDVPLAEDANRVLGSPLIARWAYSIGKAVEEILAYAYHRERNLHAVVIRLFNTVGPRQNPAYGNVIPRLVQQSVSGEPLTVFGDGTQTRCFVHVLDVVDAILCLLGQPAASGEAFNVGGLEEISMLDLAERIIKMTAVHPMMEARLSRGDVEQPSIEVTPYDKAYASGFEDMERRLADITKIRALTRWQPTRSLDDILNEAISESIVRQAGSVEPYEVVTAEGQG